MTVFKRDEIIILLGAGASADAGIPTSQGMINKIETLLAQEWKQYCDLYNFLKSSSRYLEGIKGRFEPANENIEQLVNTLEDLRRGDSHPLYPFVGAWVPKLYEVAGSDLRKVTQFRSEIVRRLRDDWVQLQHNDNASYYKGLEHFQEDYEYALRIFTLNYDLGIEKNCSTDRIERGFNSDRRWDWRLFDESRDTAKTLLLYKLHGSIDWTYDQEDSLTHLDAISQIDPDRIAIIFGTTYKLQYIDPFLFFAYELRRWTLGEVRLIIAVGYGFADEHINGILRQSLNQDKDRRLLAVTREKGTNEEERRDHNRKEAELIQGSLKLRHPNQIECWCCGAQKFLLKELRLDKLAALFPQQDSLFEEVVPKKTRVKSGSDQAVEPTDGERIEQLQHSTTDTHRTPTSRLSSSDKGSQPKMGNHGDDIDTIAAPARQRAKRRRR